MPPTTASVALYALSNTCVSSPCRIIVPSDSVISRSAVPITGHDMIDCCSLGRRSFDCFSGDAHTRLSQ
ncbi:hypothetical protein NY2A_b166L [Paramecium bursaria Chlorella virus NY2A]|uniref:Uncharacterized protein b166L n=1 Tax=Paramecium bursaria Chlorella virus NY2A TaxID=46021 RepID=A7IW41_PBCVN|nr:hypothetical protein NY2A_b166L [Paramecium bursaria Chlorella virus NY2A]ABT14565.1 hypothetical protein NY2A_b166L [Paramecium bursaria Chlorella virus NY2A]